MNSKLTLLKKVGLFILRATVIYILFYIVIVSFLILTIGRQVECRQEYILRPEVYKPAARTLARYFQSDPKSFPKGGGNTWLPEELHRTSARIYIVHSSGLYVLVGSGLHNYGFDLELEAKISNPATNIWNFSFYDEFDGTRLLETFSLPANETISEAELSAGLLTDERDSNRDYICQ